MLKISRKSFRYVRRYFAFHMLGECPVVDSANPLIRSRYRYSFTTRELIILVNVVNVMVPITVQPPGRLDFNPHTDLVPTEKPVGIPTESTRPLFYPHDPGIFHHILCLFVKCIICCSLCMHILSVCLVCTLKL